MKDLLFKHTKGRGADKHGGRIYRHAPSRAVADLQSELRTSLSPSTWIGNDFTLLLTHWSVLSAVSYRFLLLLLLPLLPRAPSADLNFSAGLHCPHTGDKIVLSSSKTATCAWWSPRIIYFDRRDTKDRIDETKVNPSLAFFFFFLPLKSEHFALFPLYRALCFRIPMHRFTRGLISLVELF